MLSLNLRGGQFHDNNFAISHNDDYLTLYVYGKHHAKIVCTCASSTDSMKVKKRYFVTVLIKTDLFLTNSCSLRDFLLAWNGSACMF